MTLAQQSSLVTGEQAEMVQRAGRAVTDALVGLWQRVDMVSDPERLAGTLARLDFFWAVVLVLIGLGLLLFGYRWYRGFLFLLAGTAGAVVGWWVGSLFEQRMVGAIAGCLVLGLLSYPLMRTAMAGLGGALGSVIGLNVFSVLVAEGAIGLPPEMGWVGSVFGAVVGVGITMAFFKPAVLVATCLCGGLMATAGAMSLLLQIPAQRSWLVDRMSAQPLLMMQMVLVLASVGLVVQCLSMLNRRLRRSQADRQAQAQVTG